MYTYMHGLHIFLIMDTNHTKIITSIYADYVNENIKSLLKLE